MRTIKNAIKRLVEAGYDFGEVSLRTRVPDAKAQMLAAMAEFVKEPVWLPEYDSVAEWLEDNNGRGLLLMGQPGLGKSLIATRVIPVLLLANMEKIITVVSARDMNRRESELECVRTLIIDDIGVEDDKNDYGEKRSVLADIVDRAERKGNILVITTNLTTGGIGNRYGERVLDRLRAITKFAVFRGKSLRK